MRELGATKRANHQTPQTTLAPGALSSLSFPPVPMTRSLPPEVKQQVLAEALALAHSAADRHHARHALRSVSREWRGALDGWHALDVAGTEQAARLKAQFNTARSRLGTLNRVKLVWVEVDSVRGFDKQGKLARLLELLTNAESVVILTGSTTLVETDRTRVFSDSVGLAPIKALSSLKRVKHFRLSSTNCQPDDLPLIDEHYLHQSVIPPAGPSQPNPLIRSAAQSLEFSGCSQVGPTTTRLTSRARSSIQNDANRSET